MKTFSILLFLFICPLLKADVLSFDSEELAFGQQRWNFQIQGPHETYSLKARVYPPTKVQVNFWDSKQTPDNLIIFPTINGSGTLEKALARYFARRGFWAVIPTIPELENPFDQSTPQRMDDMYQRVQQSAQVLQNHLNQLNPNGRNFLIGGSQGGIRSMMAAQVLEDIDAIWVSAAGGGLPSIYANSDVEQISEFRRSHMEYLGLKEPKRYESYLQSTLQYDPLTNCDRLKPRFSLVIALEDSSVPTANQLKLLENCHPQKVKKLDSGHLRGVFDLILNKRDIRQFFEQND